MAVEVGCRPSALSLILLWSLALTNTCFLPATADGEVGNQTAVSTGSRSRGGDMLRNQTANAPPSVNMTQYFTSNRVAETDQANSRHLRHTQLLKQCVNRNYSFRVSDFSTALTEDLDPNLYLDSVWWSQKKTDMGMTVVTQLSMDRLAALWDQCVTWKGPISAAVYLPLVQNRTDRLLRKNARLVNAIRQKLSYFFKRAENRASCALDLMFLWDVFKQREGNLLYPVNSLRNYARLQLRTPLMAAIDVDMVLSPSLSQQLHNPDRVALLTHRCLEKELFVLPAFEPPETGNFYGKGLVASALKGGKPVLGKLFNKGAMLQFKVKAFPSGHTPTNYTRWFSTSDTYEVKWSERYEPWFITHSAVVPYYDSKFKGYGLNKIVHVVNLYKSGFKFMVHPDGFLIHRPHKQSEARKVVAYQAFLHNQKREDVRGTLYEKVKVLYNQSSAAMDAQTYHVHVDPQVLHCSGALPWLQKVQ